MVEDLLPFLDVFIYGGFVVVIGIAWACFNVRFTEQFTADMVPDEAVLSHPATEWGIQMCTIMFLVGFTVMAGFGAAVGALHVTGHLTNTLRIILTSASVSILCIMLLIANYGLFKYMTTKHFEKMLTEKYPEELAAWEAAHPDHPLAQM